MTEEEENNEAAVWDRILAYIPAPFRKRIAVLENAVVMRFSWVGPAHILASINLQRDGYERDVVIRNSWPLRPIPLEADRAQLIARVLVDAAFETVLESLPLAVKPPLELDDAGENIIWAPTGRKGAHLPGFEQVVDLKQYLLRAAGFEYRVALADALRDAVDQRTGKKDTTVAWGTRRNIVKRKDRTVEIYGYEPMASIFLGGRPGREGRTVAAADYGVIRDEDLLAPAVSFLSFEGN
jgi:hypothetical protein